MTTGRLDALGPAGGLSDDLDVRCRVEDAAQTLANEGVVVDDEDAMPVPSAARESVGGRHGSRISRGAGMALTRHPAREA